MHSHEPSKPFLQPSGLYFHNLFCISTHCSSYIVKAFAKHVHGVGWKYHHSLGLINCTSFLVNCLSDVIVGAQSYADWIYGDLMNTLRSVLTITWYLHMSDALQTCLAMQPYNEQTAALFFVSHGDDWLCHKHSLALPAIPATTSEALQYFSYCFVDHCTCINKFVWLMFNSTI